MMEGTIKEHKSGLSTTLTGMHSFLAASEIA